MAINAPNYVQGKYTVAQRDALFDRIGQYPDAAGGLVNQVPTKTADGTIIWRNQSGGGQDGTANANIATVESSSTASQAYAVGDLLVYSGQLYRVTAAIAQGDTITPGTNVEPTTVAAAKQDITNYSAADINQYLAMVAAAPNAGGFAPSGYGLGGAISIPFYSDLDDFKNTGTYVCGTGGEISNFPPFVGRIVLSVLGNELSAVQYAYGTDNRTNFLSLLGSCCRRVYSSFSGVGEWTPWEWLNPPLIEGTEYRTTERYNGKPVYVKLLDFGALPNATCKDVLYGSNVCRGISVSGTLNNGVTSVTNIALAGAFNGTTNMVELGIANGFYIRAVTTRDLSGFTARALVKYYKTTD